VVIGSFTEHRREWLRHTLRRGLVRVQQRFSGPIASA